jgi:polyisoprenoid-binding protein YceI
MTRVQIILKGALMRNRRLLERPTVGRMIAVAFVLALLMGIAINVAEAQDSTPANEPEIGVLGAEPVFIACDENVTAAEGSEATPIPAISPATTYSIDASQSVARYRAMEELAGQGANEAIGETNSIIGQIYFDADGVPLACSRFDVDMRTLVSDEARRDNYLRGNTLQTDTYPVATFVVTAIEGLDGALADGEETSFYLVGNLTMHGATNQVRWAVTATLSGDSITGSGSTTFDMEDYGITEPVIGPVVSVDETITLEIDIVATKA